MSVILTLCDTNNKQELKDIPLEEIIVALGIYQKIYKSEILSQNPNLDENKLIISTSGIYSGSAVCKLESNEPEKLEEANLSIIQSIKNNNIGNLSPSTRKNIINMQEYLQKKNSCIFWGQKDDNIKLSPESKFPVVQKLSGETSIYGELRSIGNQKPSAKVLTSEGYLVKCTLPDKSFAKKIASNLYGTVSFKGIGKWNSENWKLEVLEVLNFVGLDNLDKLSNIWKGGDTTDFMRLVR